MKKLTLTCLPLLCCVAAAPVQADEEIELVRHMATLQYMAHKTALAIDAQNRKLAGFYLHEIEEVIEKLEEIPSFDGHPIGDLARRLLAPSVERLEGALEQGDRQKVDTALDMLIDSCNACHRSTEHGYIHIRRRSDNPFMQSFEQ